MTGCATRSPEATRFQACKDLAGFDLAASEVNKATVRTLHRCASIDGTRNVLLIGGPGTCKTHVDTAHGNQAIEHHRRKIRFFSTIELVNAIEQEKGRGKAGQIVKRLTRPDLVILNELGYLPVQRIRRGTYLRLRRDGLALEKRLLEHMRRNLPAPARCRALDTSLEMEAESEEVFRNLAVR